MGGHLTVRATRRYFRVTAYFKFSYTDPYRIDRVYFCAPRKFKVKKKYNIALLPTSKIEQLVDLSLEFKDRTSQYYLGSCSLPHVSICWFEADESDVDMIWRDINNQIQINTLTLEFNNFSYLSFDQKTYWISLIPNETEILNQMHISIAKIINGKINFRYDPHLTLANTTKIEISEKPNDTLCMNQKVKVSDLFVLSLGERDEIGQYTQLVHV